MYSTRSLAVVAPVGGVEPPQPRGAFIINHRMVMPGFFKDENVRIVSGRALDETDRPGGQPVAVISQTMAKRFWPGQDPVGKMLKRGRLSDPRPGFLVVGVAEDIQLGIDPDDGDIVGNWYVPYVQNPNFLSTNVTFIVHGSVPAESLVPTIRRELSQIDPNLALFDFNTLENMVGEAQAQDRFALLLVTLFGAIGLLLSAIGLYGLLSLQVARRTRELGVRTALGARAADIVGMIMREGFALVLVGLAVGFAAAFALTRVMQSELHGVSATDPLSYLLAAAVLSVAAAFACWLPARRAARTDPMAVLRSE
jgi:predicted permease